MPLLSDRVLESTTTTGTGTFSLGGALTGYRSFNSAFSNGDVVYYTADNGQGEWEVGYGTVGTGTLSRDTVLESSNANALVDFSAGDKRVFCTAPSEQLPPDQTGSAGKILTTDGTNMSWASPSSGPSITAVARGTLANGSKVVVNSDGTVSAAAAVTVGYGTSVVYDASAPNATYQSTNTVAYDEVNNKIVIAYKGDGYYGYAVVGTVSGGTITFGTPVAFLSASIECLTISCVANQQKFVISYQKSADSQLYSLVGTVSGTSISFGTAVSLGASPLVYYYLAGAYKPTDGKVYLAFTSTSATNYYGYYVAVTVSGTTVSYGTPTAFNSAISYITGLCFVPSGYPVVIYWDSSIYTYLRVNWSYGALNIGYGNYSYITADSASEVVYTALRNSSSGYLQVAAYSVASTTLSGIGSTTPASVDNGPVNIAYDSTSGYFLCSGQASSSSGYSTNTYLLRYNAASTSWTLIGGPYALYYTFNTRPIFAQYISALGKCVVVTSNSYSTPYGGYVSLFNSSPSTLTASNYIGISDAAYTSGQTATVQIVGSVDDAQTGLTAGKAYYVQLNGTLSTTPATPSVFAGTAISSTSIIVKG